MKIQCQSCQAKYTIADEKVLGKVVKIRCKKCSATIVINGNETRSGVEENADANAFDYAAQANDVWTVNVADGDQRTMTSQEVVTEYRAGTINDETYCWKEGMADWLPLREVEVLAGAIKQGARPPADSIHDDISIPPQSAPASNLSAGALFSSNEMANPNANPNPTSSPYAANAANAVNQGAASANGNNGHGYYGAESSPAPSAAAARRGGGRGQGADLFGNVASAGGEEDVMTSAAPPAHAPHAHAAGMEEQKLTGQRNESSVLFSLSALTDAGKNDAAAQNRTTATADGSGLIDIRALSQTMGADDKRDTNARVDDIMNLSGGGAFGAALAAPILAPPPLEMSSDPYSTGTSSGKPNTLLLVAIIGGAALIAVGIVVAVLLTRPTGGPTDTASASPTGTMASAIAAATNEPTPTAAPTTPPTAATTAAPSEPTPAPPGTGNANAKAPTVTPNRPAAAAAQPKDPAAPAIPKAPEPPKDFGAAVAAAAGRSTQEAPREAAPSGVNVPFDRGAAAAALGSVNVQSCRKPDGPTGPGHIKVTFAPNGTVTSAVVDSGPYPGTAVGGCVAGRFRAAHIPAFSGPPQGVGKSFTIN